MRSKRILTVLALLIVAALVFAACTGNGGGTVDPTTTTPVTTTTTTTQPDATVPELPPEPTFPDMGGRVVRISSGANSNFGFMGRLNEDSTFYVPHPETTSDFHRLTLQYENRVRVEEAFNIVIEPIAMGGGDAFTRMTTARLAGEIYADGMNMTTRATIDSMLNDYIYPLERLAAMLPVELDLFTNNFWAWPCMVHAGYTWNMARPLPPMNNQGIFVNLDIIETFGAPNPVELFERGQWTWDAMREIMEMTTADTTGDGNIDTWGISGNMNDGIRHFLVANDAYVVNPETFQLAYDSPEALAALQFIYDIFANGWFMPGDPAAESPARGGGENTLSFGLGRSALGMATTPGNINNQIGAGFDANLSWVPFPLGPNNTSGLTGENGGRGGAGVLRGVEEPQYILWILDELFAWPGDEWFEVENQADVEWARRFMPDEASVQRLFNAGINERVSVPGRDAQARVCIGYRAGILGSFHQNMVEYWFRGEMTVSQAVEFWRGDRQAALDEFFGDWSVR